MRQRFGAWSDRRHSKGTSTELGQRNIYILPTRAGLMFVVLLLCLLVGAINYQLNLGYLLTFMLAGVGVMSMHMTHRNLRGLTLALQPLEPAHAGNVAAVRFVLSVEKAQRYGIALWCEGDQREHASVVDVQPQSPTQVSLAMPLATRGWQRVVRVNLETRFPLGLWRAWSHWQPSGDAARVLAYPKIETPAPTLPYWQDHTPDNADSLAQTPIHTGEYDGVRPYRVGDAKKRVVWKKFAKADELVTRDDVSTATDALVLDFQALGGLDTEARLSRLTAWVLACQKQDTAFELRLGKERLAQDVGAAHAHAALHRLALFGNTNVDTMDNMAHMGTPS
jgi:uncharacterized protein (DUF58 family)